MKCRISARMVYRVLFLTIFTALAITYVFPLLFVLVNSFKSNMELLRALWALPQSFAFTNYVYIFKNYHVGAMFINSIVLTFGGIAVSATMVTLTSYTLARFKFIGRNFLFAFALVVMFIPSMTALPAIYKLMSDLRLIGTIICVLILYAGPFGMNFFVMYAYFKGISSSYSEAAKIDGASEMAILLRIMLPMTSGGIAVIALMSGIGYWNDYLTPYIYMRGIQTLATGLQDLTLNAQNRGKYVELFAATIVTILPVITVFVFLQNKIIGNIMTGGLKG